MHKPTKAFHLVANVQRQKNFQKFIPPMFLDEPVLELIQFWQFFFSHVMFYKV